MKKMKKLTSLLLVLVMSLALAVPCFAAEPAAADDGNTIYLEMGDTYTDPETGYTYSFEPLGSTSTLSARGFPSYILKNEPMTGSSFHGNYTADPDLGNVFVVEVYNKGAESIWATLNMNLQGRDRYISVNTSGELRIQSDNPNQGVSGTASVLVRGLPGASAPIELNGTISIYEIWE